MDFGSMFQTWLNVLTRPGEEVFEEERQSGRATLATAFIWIIIAAVIAAVFNAIGAVVGSFLGGAGAITQFLDQLPPEVASQYEQYAEITAGSIGAAIFSALCLTIIFTPIFFGIGSLIYFAVAKLFSGEGEFEEQTYFLATFTAPLIIVSSLISIIPLLGGCVAFILLIYRLVLTYFAVKVSHNLTSGAAVAVALAPIVLLFLLLCCCGVVGGILISSLASGSGDFQF